ARSHPTTTPTEAAATRLPRLVSTRFQALFPNPSPGHFSPFPHGTRPLSVIRKYLGLPGGPGRFTQDSSSPVLLGKPPRQSQRFHLPGSHGLRPPIPGTFGYHHDLSLPGQTAAQPKRAPTTPHTQRPPAITRARFSLLRVRS